MATEDLQINIGANTQDLQNGLNQASQSVQNFGAQVSKVTKPTADSTNALTNLSRVAQDAPYGFMGIANNLNPLLESFQRLSKETGSTGNALKSMVSGLMGPAGIGVALGVVSSLIVAFGGDIMDFISGTDEAKKAQDEFNKSLEQAKQKAAEQATSLNLLIAIAQSANATDEQRAKALNAVKEALGKVNKDYAAQIKTVDDAKVAVNLYTQALIQQAIVQRYQDKIADKTIELTNLTKEVTKATLGYAEAQRTAASMNNGYVDSSVTQAAVIGEAKSKLDAAKNSYNATSDAVKELNKDLKTTTEEAVKMPFFTDLLLGKSGSSTQKVDKPLKTNVEKDYSLQDHITQLENDTKATLKWADEQMKIHDKMLAFYKKYGDVMKADTSSSSLRDMIEKQDKEREKQTEKTPFSEKKLDTKNTAVDREENRIKKFDKDLQDSQKDAQKYAEFMANTLSGAFNAIFDAMQDGKNPLQALGGYLEDLVKKFAAAAVQAAILQGIMMLINPAGAAAGGGFIGQFSKILGFAEGGIVSRPTVAMVGEGGQSEAIMPLNKLSNMMNSTFNAGAMSGVGGGSGNGQFVLKGNDLVLALQRSNYSLNLRRGNGI